MSQVAESLELGIQGLSLTILTSNPVTYQIS